MFTKEEILAYKVQGFPVLYDKRMKAFKKRDMVENVWEKISENLDFEAAACRCFGVNFQENTHSRVLL